MKTRVFGVAGRIVRGHGKPELVGGEALRLVCVCLGVAVLAVPAIAFGWPSGGPYGPVFQSYSWPSNAAHVYVVAPDGRADAPGTLEQPTSIESAVARASTGDAIVMRGGVYRVGGLVLNQGILIQPYRDEQPVLKGTLVATNWTRLPSGLWRTRWPRLFPAKPADWWHRAREGVHTPLWLFNNDMVFVDGRPLKAVGWEGAVNQDSFYINYEAGDVYIGVDPGKHTIEITAWDVAILRTTNKCHGRESDRKGYTLKGLTFTQYAYRALEIEGTEPEGPADPTRFGKDVVGTTLEHVTITHCSRVAGYLRGDRLVLRHCLISDTSTEGIYILASSDCLLERNIFRRNNVEGITGYFPAAVKIFNQCHRVVCRDNLVLDNRDSNGIWYDVGNVDGVFVDNWIMDSQAGFFFEISKGAICAGNVFVNCDKGVYVLNSADVRVYNNTFVDTCAWFERTPRSTVGDRFGWHPATGPDVDRREGHEFVGNLLVATAGFNRPLFRAEQTPRLCGRLTRPQLTKFDYNLYVRAQGGSSAPLYRWSPVEGADCNVDVATPADLNRLAVQFEGHSMLVSGAGWPVLRSVELMRYEPAAELPVRVPGSVLPQNVLDALGWGAREWFWPGAYQSQPAARE